jgi:hypothetical protein
MAAKGFPSTPIAAVAAPIGHTPRYRSALFLTSSMTA